MMADAAGTAAKAGKGGLGFLAHKVGPLPLGIWLVAGLGIYLYFQRQQAGAAATAAGTTAAGAAGANAGGAGSTGSGGGDGSAGQSGTPGVPVYADNNAWGIAAVNYLVGRGIDATVANQAIELYLSSQPLTTSQQADVNLAIQALGPPPQLPGPIAGNPSPVVTPPGGGTTGGAGGGAQNGKPVTAPPGTRPPATVPGKPPAPRKSVPPPTGLVVSAKSGHSLAVKWNRSAGASGYHVLCTDMATKKIASEHDTGPAELTATFQGLTPSHSYVVDVWALPRAAGNTAHAEVSATLPRTG